MAGVCTPAIGNYFPGNTSLGFVPQEPHGGIHHPVVTPNNQVVARIVTIHGHLAVTAEPWTHGWPQRLAGDIRYFAITIRPVPVTVTHDVQNVHAIWEELGVADQLTVLRVLDKGLTVTEDAVRVREVVPTVGTVVGARNQNRPPQLERLAVAIRR